MVADLPDLGCLAGLLQSKLLFADSTSSFSIPRLADTIEIAIELELEG
jgi:hypothetical protein